MVTETDRYRLERKVVMNNIMEMVSAFYISQTLNVCCRLELFTRLSGNPLTLGEVAEALGLHPRPAEMLLNACVALGLLEKDQGRYRNTEWAEGCLVKGRKGYYGNLITMMVDLFYSSWGRLEEAIKKNEPVEELFLQIMPGDEETARKFTLGSHDNKTETGMDIALANALELSWCRNLLDVGGGSGALSIAVCEKNPHLETVVFDLPMVCKIAQEFIQESAVIARVKTRPGNYLEDELPGGFDAALLSNIIHLEGSDTCRMLARKIFGSLNPSGMLIVLDILLDEDKKGPLFATLFALNMLVSTPRGNTYTASEVRGWLEEAGFIQIEQRCLTGPSSIITGRKPA